MWSPKSPANVPRSIVRHLGATGYSGNGIISSNPGINVNLKDNHGRSALWFAKEKRDMPIYYSLAGDPRLNDNEIINPFGSPPHQCHTCSEMEEKTTVTAMLVLSILVALFVAAVLRPTCD
ncbi:uncharacterized protein BO96DRAFT_417314 [Aspergillus niger CBS 101883]|uniref:uncharacterized protein n=1 Tax=Aspergillus lacticoffeatus (strain CBS 101883) TaxID=1450533 RepID=UPI000D7F18C4|nr:uncharacterized protein BO96DRAFT_417314 [Aspergillus niger CBS 101883]PYH61759.1 hypothetical protein BO96DRAFT_417314 [Aspergillus niger CBS 101883]